MGQRPPQKLYKYVGEKTALLILGSGQLQFSVFSFQFQDYSMMNLIVIFSHKGLIILKNTILN